MSSESAEARGATGVAYALSAYTAWGLLPVFWKQLAGVSPGEIIAHRVVWSFLFVAVLLSFGRRWGEFGQALRRPRTFLALLLTSALIGGNWLLYVWAVNSGRVMEGSLGYYINPLVNLVLARVVLGERLRPLQRVAVGLAGVGVLTLSLGVGGLPWVSLALALSFGVYGLVRKVAQVEPLTGLAVETALSTPVALLFLGLGAQGAALPGGWQGVLLVACGVATALPLLWYAQAARRLRFSTLSIIQYVSPTLQLALAVLVYGESFTARHAVTFGFIWTAVALYVADGLLGRQRAVAAPVAVARR